VIVHFDTAPRKNIKTVHGHHVRTLLHSNLMTPVVPVKAAHARMNAVRRRWSSRNDTPCGSQWPRAAARASTGHSGLDRRQGQPAGNRSRPDLRRGQHRHGMQLPMIKRPGMHASTTQRLAEGGREEQRAGRMVGSMRGDGAIAHRLLVEMISLWEMIFFSCSGGDEPDGSGRFPLMAFITFGMGAHGMQ